MSFIHPHPKSKAQKILGLACIYPKACSPISTPSPEVLAVSLNKKRVRNGLPTAVDRWIAAGLNSESSRADYSQVVMVPRLPTLANILEDLVECQLSTMETEVLNSNFLYPVFD